MGDNAPNQSLLPTTYVAGAPPAAAEFKRYAEENLIWCLNPIH